MKYIQASVTGKHETEIPNTVFKKYFSDTCPIQEAAVFTVFKSDTSIWDLFGFRIINFLREFTIHQMTYCYYHQKGAIFNKTILSWQQFCSV